MTQTSHGDAIDTHAHLYPSAYLDRLESIGVPADTTAIARGLGADSTPDELAERLRWMDRAGVAVQVLSATPQVPAGPDAGSSAEAARWINDELTRVERAHPDRFRSLAALPLPHVDEALAELPRALDELGHVGVSLPTVLPGQTTLADERFEPVWAALDERGAVVNIHATGSGVCSPLIADHGLTWVNGAPVEDGTAVLHLLTAGVPDRFPRIRFHVAHLGGDLPFIARRLEDNYEDWDSFPSSPTAALRRMWFDAANFGEPSLRLAAEVLGADRIIAGSDFPYFREDKYVRAFDYVRDASLPTDQIDAMLHGTAARLFGLDPA